MALNQIIDLDPLSSLVVDDTLNLKCNNLRAKENISTDNLDTNTINHVQYPPGGGFLPTPVASKVLITDSGSVVQWGNVTPANLSGGTDNQFIGKRTGTIQFTDIVASDITGGTNGQFIKRVAGVSTFTNIHDSDILHGNANQILVTDPTGSFSNYSLNINPMNIVASNTVDVGTDLTVQNNVAIIGDITNVTYMTITADIVSNGSFLTDNGQIAITGNGNITINNGSFLVAGSGGLSVPVGDSLVNKLTVNGELDFPPGPPVLNKLLSVGVDLKPFWTDNINIQGLILSGEFAVTGGSPGAANDVLYSRGAGLPPQWAAPLVRPYYVKYYDNTVVNLNGAATVLMFAAATADIADSRITYTSGAGGGFTVSQTGVYEVTVNVKLDSQQFKTQINIVVNSVYKGSQQNLNNAFLAGVPNQIALQKKVFVNSGEKIQIISEPIVAGAVNTSGVDNHGIATTDVTIGFVSET